MERTPDWWKSAVVYQIYPRSFADGDGDGIGDLRGVLGHLDHLVALGVDVVWMSPIYRSPQADNGYDISDYEDIDPLFGTLADLDELIAELHARDIKLVMDLVVNHTSDEHPWFQESRDRDSEKADWYWWADPRPGAEAKEPGAEPTNWKSAFGGPAWSFDERRGQYYLHVFGSKQPDLNWENPAVRHAVHDMMRRWVERGIDGFRMDVISLISKRLPLSDDERDSGKALSPHSGYVDGPRMDEFLHEMNTMVLKDRHLLTVGECPGIGIEQASKYTDPTREELGMVFQFEHMELDEQAGRGKWALKSLHLPDLKATFARWQEGLEGRGWNSLYWNNHDQPRIVSRWGDDSDEHRVNSAKTLGTVLHMMKGTPFIYQGEEIGMTNAGFTSIGQYRDLETLNHHAEAMASGEDEQELLRAFAVKSRDNARYPMSWDDSEQAGFTTGVPWLPVHRNHVEVNVAAARDDRDSVFHHYRRLIELRHTNPIVRDGVFNLLHSDDEQLFSYTRTLDGVGELLIVANMSSWVCPLPADCRVGGQVLLATHRVRAEYCLAPWESRVLALGRPPSN